MSLVLTRRPGEAIVIDGDITVRVVGVVDNQVRLAIDAPQDTEIWREELLASKPRRRPS